MNEAQAIYTVIIGVGALSGVIMPVIKLNNSITKLTSAIEYMGTDNKRQDTRLDAHSKELDDHERRISHLEG
jgi:hypothetical protein